MAVQRPLLSQVLSALLQPSWQVIVFSVFIALLLPVLLHLALYRKSARTNLPTFLLVGTSGSGKTSLLTLIETGTPATTRTSQTLAAVELSLPTTAQAFSSRFRSSNDPSLAAHKKFLLTDTPGHGKLRSHALRQLTNPSNLKGIIFLVDAANLPANSPELREVAEYLHDILLVLQKSNAKKTLTRDAKMFPVLVGANKMDLFTALPEHMVQKALELEISEVRHSRATGLMDSGVGMDDKGIDSEREWLGEGGETIFDFEQMNEAGVEVTVQGGVAAGAEGSDIDKWWQWIADQM